VGFFGNRPLSPSAPMFATEMAAVRNVAVQDGGVRDIDEKY
jgi:hypothetical protein